MRRGHSFALSGGEGPLPVGVSGESPRVSNLLFVTLAISQGQVVPSSPLHADWSIPLQYFRIVTAAQSMSLEPFSPSVKGAPAKIRVAFASSYWFRHR